MTLKKIFVFAALSLTLALVACGGSEEPEDTGPARETINVTMNDIYYGETADNQENPPIWTVTSGAEVTVRMDNQGALEHNWAIVRPEATLPDVFDETEDADLLLFNAGVLAGGTTQTATFTAPEPGEYLIICTVAGHYPLMQGRLVVEASG